MDFRNLLSKITLLEAITMADVKAAVGQEADEQKRAAILNDLAWKNNLPGLYDPVSGYFVGKQSMPTDGGRYSIGATAREADTQALAKMGLVPQTANTSALGGLVGTGSLFGSKEDNAKAAQAVKDTSNKFNADATSKSVNGQNLAKLNDLVAKLTGKPSATDQIGADAAAYNAAKAATVQQGAQKVQQGAQPAGAKLPASSKPWDSQVKESLQRKLSSLLNEEFGIEERVLPGEETPPGINRLTGKPIAEPAAPAPADAAPAVVPLSKRFDPRFKNGPEPYTIDIDGTVYKFAGRDKSAPGGGEVIKVPAAVIGIRGLGAVSVELGKDGMYYAAPQQESLAESMGSLRDLLAQLEEGELSTVVGKQVGRGVARQAAQDAGAAAKAIGQDAGSTYKMNRGAADITDVEEKKKLAQWLAANPGKTAAAGIAALGLGAAGLDASGRKNAATDPRVASNAANPASQADVRKVDNAISANAGTPTQAAQPAAGAAPTRAAGSSGGADGATGQALAALGVSKKDRLNQEFVDKTLGAGKYKAGSAQANLALLAHFKANGGNKPAEPAKADAATPAAPAGPTPEQAELIKQIQAVMMDLQGNDDDPAIVKALGDAQAAIDSVGKAPAAAAPTPPAP